MSAPPQTPPYIPKANEIEPIIDRIISEYVGYRDILARNILPETATFDKVVQGLLELSDQIQGDLAVISCLGYASPDKATRDAVYKAQSRFSVVVGDMLARDDLFSLIKAVNENAESLNPEHKKLARELLRDYTSAGHGTLSKTLIDDFKDRRDQIDELRRTFNENLRSENGGLWFSNDQLEGLSEDQIADFTKGTEPLHFGKTFVSFKRSDYNALMTYADHPTTREAMYLANEQKLTQNVPLFSKVVKLRDINAHLLGYKSHAAFRLERRMAQSPERVEQFLTSLREGLALLAKNEVEQLHARKRAHIAANASNKELGSSSDFFPWDFHYYTRLFEQDHNVQHEKLAEYFPLQYTVAAMLRLFAACLGLTFIQMPTEDLSDRIWHADVTVYSVWECASGNDGVHSGATTFIGYLYLDLLWREGKYRGNQNVNLQRVRSLKFHNPDDDALFDPLTPY